MILFYVSCTPRDRKEGRSNSKAKAMTHATRPQIRLCPKKPQDPQAKTGFRSSSKTMTGTSSADSLLAGDPLVVIVIGITVVGVVAILLGLLVLLLVVLLLLVAQLRAALSAGGSSMYGSTISCRWLEQCTFSGAPISCR